MVMVVAPLRRALLAPARATPASLLAPPPHAGLPHATLLLSYGLNGPLQSVRDASQLLFNSFGLRAALVFLVLGVITSVGGSAWAAGRQYRKLSASSELQGSDLARLAACLVIDFIGLASFSVGETDDITWAPISALILRFLFQSDTIAALDFVKEILPLTDIVPVASLAWLLETAFPESFAARALGLDGGKRQDGQDM